jgi:iron complex outermembrane recepter protein
MYQEFVMRIMSSASFLAMAAFAATVSPVMAQYAAADNAELIVTLQKREQPLQKVPVAVTSVNKSFIEDTGITDFAELALFVPGFEVQDQSPNNSGFVMRGITTDSGSATSETRVSTYQDGVSISRSRGSYVELFDIDRVEVAKGPQSTLFGRSALIGAVNIVQTKADLKAFGLGFAASTGNYNYRLVDAMINAPITDSLAVRLAVRSKARDGYVENLLGSDDFNGLGTDAYRLSVQYKPTDRLRFDLITNVQIDDTPGTAFKSGTFVPTNPETGAVIGDLSNYSGAALSTAFGFKGGRNLGLKREISGTTLIADYKLNDAFSLSSLTAYRRFKSSEVFDPDGFSLPLFVFAEDSRSNQWSQEFRLKYDNNDRLSWFTGINYFRERGSQTIPLQIDERVFAAFNSGLISRPVPQASPTIVAGLGGLGSLLKRDHLETPVNYGDTDSFDVYADATYKLTEKLEVSGGVRYTRDDKVSGYSANVRDNSLLVASQGRLGLLVQPTKNNGDRIDFSFKDESVTWRLIANYSLDAANNLYVSAARGRQPVTYSTGTPATPFGKPTFTKADAETVDSLEFGWKTRLLENKLSIDSALYGYKYDNFQTSIRTAAGSFVTVSAGEANTYGFETQANYRPTAGVDLFATYAYNKARFGNGRFKGNSFRLAPDHTVALGLRFKHEFSAGELSLVPTYTWQSKVFFDDNNDLPAFQPLDKIQNEVQKAYALANLRIGFTPKGTNVTIEGFIDNAFNKKYIKDAGNTGDSFGIATFIEGEPQMVGLTLRYKY